MGRVQGMRPPPPPEMTCGFLIQLVFCKKKKNYVVYWCWSRARDECTPLKKSWIRPCRETTTDIARWKWNTLWHLHSVRYIAHMNSLLFTEPFFVCFVISIYPALQEIDNDSFWSISWRKLRCDFGRRSRHICWYPQLLQTASASLGKRRESLLYISLERSG